MGRYVPAAGAGDALARMPEMRSAMLAAAGEVKSQAEAASPVGHSRVGYRRRFVTAEVDGKAAVGNADPFAHLVEWGSVNNPAYAPIRRGVNAAGLRLDEAPKR